MNVRVERNRLRVSLWRMLAGAVVGGVSTFLFLELLGEKYFDLADPSTMLAVVAGLIYALMGLSVGFGIIAPAAGARFLNVEDADELREERPKLKTAATACVLIGFFFLVLALSGEGGLLGREVAVLIAAACLVGIGVLTVISKRTADELTRQVSLQSSSLALHVALIGLAIWALLAQLGYAGGIDPLALISGLALLQLTTVFVVAGQKGMLMR